MIFKAFENMLKNDERIQFTVSKKGGQLCVLIQPVMSGSLDNFTSEAAQSLRAALSMPLHVTTTAEVLDRDFPQSLAAYAQVRDNGHGDLEDVLSRIKEAGKQAKAEAKAGGPKQNDADAIRDDVGEFKQPPDKSLF